MHFKTPQDEAAAHHFFADRPLALSLFQQLTARVEPWGPMQLVATKSRVAFLAKTRFLWCHEATQDGIWLGFLHPVHLTSPRLRSGPSGKRWSHHLKVTAAPDKELLAWLKEAYAGDVGK